MHEPRVAVSLLGPLECRVDGDVLELTSRSRRVLLAMLAMRAPKTVSRDELVDGLWGDAPPPSARNSLEAHISRLRSASPALTDAVRTRLPGYALDAATDVQELERLRSAAAEKLSAGDPKAAAAELATALRLWRGPALADVADAPFAQPEAARLEDLHLLVTEDSMRARLASGQGPELLPELERLVAEHPLREGLREQQMLALYRAGRQADALAAYRDIQRGLRDELGLDPPPSLRELEQAILRHDPALVPPGATPSDERPRPSRRRVMLALGIAALLVVALAAILTRSLRSSPAHASPGKPQPLGKHLVASVPVPLPACCGIGFGSVWVAGHHDGTLYRIDPDTNRIVERYPVLGFQAHAPLAAVGSIWVPAAAGDLVRFDPATKRVVARFPVETANIAWGYGVMWVTTRDQRLLRIDYGRNTIAGQRRLAPGVNDFDNGVAVAYGSVWVTLTDRSELLRIDPSTMKVVARISGFGQTYGWMPLSPGDGSIWVYRVTGSRGMVYRVDPATNTIVQRIPEGLANVAWPNGNDLDAVGYVWSCDAGNTLTQIDPASKRVVGWYTLPNEVCSEIAEGFGSLWLSFYDHSLIYRITP